jgi:hypothetical protein
MADDQDAIEVARIMGMSDEEILAGVTPDETASLVAEVDKAARAARQRQSTGMEEAIRAVLSDCSTVDFYGISDEGVANLAMLAARAVTSDTP